MRTNDKKRTFDQKKYPDGEGSAGSSPICNSAAPKLSIFASFRGIRTRTYRITSTEKREYVAKTIVRRGELQNTTLCGENSKSPDQETGPVADYNELVDKLVGMTWENIDLKTYRLTRDVQLLQLHRIRARLLDYTSQLLNHSKSSHEAAAERRGIRRAWKFGNRNKNDWRHYSKFRHFCKPPVVSYQHPESVNKPLLEIPHRRVARNRHHDVEARVQTAFPYLSPARKVWRWRSGKDRKRYSKIQIDPNEFLIDGNCSSFLDTNGPQLMRSDPILVGTTLKGRFRVVSLKSEEDNYKVYIVRDLWKDLYELRVYPFGEVGNSKKKQIWRDCQRHRKRRNFVEAWKLEGNTFMLFYTKLVSFEGIIYILGADMTAFQVQDSIIDGDMSFRYHRHDDPPDINNLEEFPPLPHLSAVQDSITDEDMSFRYHRHDAPPGMNGLEDFPPLPRLSAVEADRPKWKRCEVLEKLPELPLLPTFYEMRQHTKVMKLPISRTSSNSKSESSKVKTEAAESSPFQPLPSSLEPLATSPISLPQTLLKAPHNETASTPPTDGNANETLPKYPSLENVPRSEANKNTLESSLDPLLEALTTKIFSFENLTKMLNLPAGSRNDDVDPPTVLENIVKKVLEELPKTINSKTPSNGTEKGDKATKAAQRKAGRKEMFREARRVQRLEERRKKALEVGNILPASHRRLSLNPMAAPFVPRLNSS